MDQHRWPDLLTLPCSFHLPPLQQTCVKIAHLSLIALIANLKRLNQKICKWKNPIKNLGIDVSGCLFLFTHPFCTKKKKLLQPTRPPTSAKIGRAIFVAVKKSQKYLLLARRIHCLGLGSVLLDMAGNKFKDWSHVPYVSLPPPGPPTWEKSKQKMLYWDWVSNLFHVQLLNLPLFVVFQTYFPILVLLLEQQNANKSIWEEIRLTRNIDFCPPLPIEALQDRGKSSSLEDSLEAQPVESSHI